MGKKYQSTYDRIMDEAIKEGRFHVLSEETNIKIMQELAWTDEEIREERNKRIGSELELRNIILD